MPILSNNYRQTFREVIPLGRPDSQAKLCKSFEHLCLADKRDTAEESELQEKPKELAYNKGIELWSLLLLDGQDPQDRWY